MLPLLDYINFFIEFISDVVKAMHSMYIVPGVSLLSLIVAALIVVTFVVCVFR